MAAAKNEKKQVPLRLNAQLYSDLAAWAEDDFRSLNGQIEYLLTECVRRRKGKPAAPAPELPEIPDVPDVSNAPDAPSAPKV